MSKSLGTGVDPLELIADYGADATRFGLAYMSSVQDVRFSAERIEMGGTSPTRSGTLRAWCCRAPTRRLGTSVELATPADRWIFSRLAAVTRRSAGLYESYEFDDVARLLYRFVWNELCDWYLEVAKTRLYSEDEAERLQVSGNLLVLLEQVMTLAASAHALRHRGDLRLPARRSTVRAERAGQPVRCHVPGGPARVGTIPEAETAMEAFTAVVGGLRSTREELGLARDVVGSVRILELKPGAAAAVIGPAGRRSGNSPDAS